ncbi:hypothetical protein GM608_06855 [Bombella sp. ESL0380]|uniref:hypothetical protein n=1 Tax=Bombella sp. ESL0380 TaxID=2676444 RepID=UPI00139EF3DE|nr:hypothetical protein [Bombella sp. ESL0380]
MMAPSVGERHGPDAMMQAVTGLHMNPLLALLLVVGLIFVTPWCLRRLKHRMPALLRDEGLKDRALKVQDAIPLGGKRTLFSVAVRDAEGRQATAIILTGGPSDLCVGWLGAGAASRLAKQCGQVAEERQEMT